jgi:hypothetical protein
MSTKWMATEVKYPEMRREVTNALAVLADPEYQQRVWIDRNYPEEGFYDDLTLNINILYDMVLPDPKRRQGAVLLNENEVEQLTRLENVLGPLTAELRDALDSRYLSDPRWEQVVRVAGSVLVSMNVT